MKEVYIAQVIVNHNSGQTDKIFDYKVPEHLLETIQEGMRVLVSFGRGNKKLEAYILNIKVEKEPAYRLKEILYPIDDKPILDKRQIKMIVWLKNKYLCKYVEAIQCVLPSGIVNKEKRSISLIVENWKCIVGKNSSIQIEILHVLMELGGKATLENLYSKIPKKDLNQPIKRLEEKNIIKIDYEITAKVKIKTERYVKIAVEDKAFENALEDLKNAKRQKEILLFLKQHKECLVSEVLELLKVTRAPLSALEVKGYIEFAEKEQKRDPFKNISFKEFPKLSPNIEQQNVISQIEETIESEKHDTFLIHGVTGSGKTEIYLQLIEAVKKIGKQGIILVPEIALTPQTVERFYGRFGNGIAVLHSNLSEGERFDEWRKIAEGKVDIVIGARSAIFAPLKKLGIIIIDEEHEHTYKSEINPKYHAVEVAQYRGQQENAVVVLGSATPSIESYYKVEKEEVTLFTLHKRATNATMPEVEIVDMTEELNSGNKGMLSRSLFHAVEENIKNKKQTILFLNRRGYSTFISCRQCGYVVKCNNCDITMTYHRTMKHVQCHYCGEKKEKPQICPDCESDHINFFGAGTQKIEDMIAEYFPDAIIGRMDMDTTSIKGSHQRILEKFKRGDMDILVGTQMISKGLDFPNVTLVGIIAADSTLNLPDFRASEKTFQLVTQVSGRSGRGKDKGKVILQTYNPDHYSIQAASQHHYHQFYSEEINLRKAFDYPPFTQLININFSGKNEKEVYSISQKIANNIKYILSNKGHSHHDDIIMGPNPAIIAKVNERYRYQILLKSHGVDFLLLKSIVKYLLIDNRQKTIPSSIILSIDINPFHMM
ncbi:MAG: primosomal protein N' [Clostridiaceae bacterium]|nr:primosomal protein N' [Clostridiaceae bacterium]